MQENIFLKRLSGLKCFPAFGNPRKHDAGVFYISSSEKEIITSITFFKLNIFCIPHGYSEACKSCEHALVAIN